MQPTVVVFLAVWAVGAAQMPPFLESLGQPDAVRTCYRELQSSSAERSNARTCIVENMPFSFILNIITSFFSGSTSEQFMYQVQREFRETEEGRATMRCAARKNGLLTSFGELDVAAFNAVALDKVQGTSLLPHVQMGIDICPTPSLYETLIYMECLYRVCAEEVATGQ